MEAKQVNSKPAAEEEDFLGFMDEYLDKLTSTRQPHPKPHIERGASSETIQLQRKLELYEKKFKEMQLNNHLEVTTLSCRLRNYAAKTRRCVRKSASSRAILTS